MTELAKAEKPEKTDQDQAQSVHGRAWGVTISLVLGVIAGVVTNWLASNSSKPQDHVVVACIVGCLIAGMALIALVDSPDEN